MSQARHGYQAVNTEDSEHLESQQVPLHYLKNHTPEEIAQLKEKYGVDEHELEGIIAQHSGSYNWYYILYTFSRWTNISFPFYAGPKSGVGIQKSVATLFPNVKVPDGFANSSGWTLSALSTAFFMAAIDPEKLAVRFTLEYAHSASMKEKFDDFREKFSAAPGQTLFDLAKNVSNQIALNTVNFLGAATSFIGISPYLSPYPVLWWLGLATFTYPQYRYFDGYSNDEFWEGINFFLDQNRPWLITEFQKNPALAMRVLMEGVSAVLLRSVANYSVADSTRDELGFCPNSDLVFAISIYVFLMQFYPTTYNYYLEDKVNANKKLAESKAESAPAPLPNPTPNPAPSQGPGQASETTTLLPSLKQLEEKVQNERGYGFPLKEESSLIWPLAFRAYIGAYYGSSFGIPGAIIGAAAMLAWSYRAERQRIVYKLVAQELRIKAMSVKDSKCRANPATIVADTFTLGGAASNLASSMGQANDVVGGSPLKLGAYLLANMDGTINGVRFAIHKTRSTMESMGKTISAGFSKTYATLFNGSSSSQCVEEKLSTSKRSISPARSANF
jgi:hypothetical protein